jgi:hypothetical protein
MPYPTTDTFRDLLLTRPLGDIVRDYIFEGTPFVFRSQPQGMNTLRRHLCPRFNLKGDNVIVIGSAKIGFSLNPDSYFAPFTEESDIDVLVVDEKLFDEAWSLMLQWNYPLRRPGIRWHANRKSNLYWGWFEPARLKFQQITFLPPRLAPLRDMSTRWFQAFRGLALYPEFASRDVSGRLYRTWDHARLYHEEGLRQILEAIKT